MYYLNRLFLALLITTPWSCGENLLKEAASTTSDYYFLEEAKKALNKKDYDSAQKNLDKIKNKSSEEHILQVSVYLGANGFSMWDILIDTADSLTSSSGSGLESLFNALSGSNSIFGNEEERFTMMAGISTSITYLRDLEGSTDNDSKLTNIRCILASILLLPTSADTTLAVNNTFAALNSITAELSNPQTTCPSLDGLTEATTNMALIQANLDLVLQTAGGCSIMEFLSQSGAITQLNNTINRMVAGADKGCSSIDCGNSAICQALAVPCVESLLNTSGAVAGDGVVTQCEIMQNCQTITDCF